MKIKNEELPEELNISDSNLAASIMELENVIPMESNNEVDEEIRKMDENSLLQRMYARKIY